MLKNFSFKRLATVLIACFIIFTSVDILAKEKSYSNWEDVSSAMAKHLDEALSLYEKGGDENAKGATDAINVAYFKFYEKLGFEKTVMSVISGERGSAVEHQFYRAKRSIKKGESVETFKEEIETLKKMLDEDAKHLDNLRSGSSNETSNEKKDVSENQAVQGFSTFIAVFGLTMREGLEAILVVAAIAAYLTKTNSKNYLKGVYAGALLGIVFSVILAVIFNIIAQKVGDTQSGVGQEIFEGIAMFVAVAVLFYVSNWMLSKSEVEIWNQYIQSHVEQSISKGNMFALMFTSFLAVAREGAELILFFQGMRSNIMNSPYHMWLGLAVAAVVLVLIYFAITKLTIRLPLKPFFTVTSWLMFILCISFAGKGVFELQEADVIGRTIIPQMKGFTIDLLGIYPRVETLLPQIILLVLIIFSVIYQHKNNKKKRMELEAKHKKEGGVSVEKENI